MLLPVALGAAIAAPSSATPAHSRLVAVAARTLNLNLYAQFHLIGRPGHVLTEQGTFTGTLSGTASSRNVTISSTKGTGTFVLYTKSGALSGEGTTHSRTVGATVSYTGTAKITSGTGEWTHASGSELTFSGTVNRQNYRFTEHITGSLRY